MSIISCTNDCVYQKDGCCCLERAASVNERGHNKSCIHYIQNATNISKTKK